MMSQDDKHKICDCIAVLVAVAFCAVVVLSLSGCGIARDCIVNACRNVN